MGGLDPPNAEETRLLGIGVSSVIRAHLTATCTPLQRHLPPLTATYRHSPKYAAVAPKTSSQQGQNHSDYTPDNSK